MAVAPTLVLVPPRTATPDAKDGRTGFASRAPVAELPGCHGAADAATAAMLDFCAEHGITADIELLPSARVNEALDRLGRGDVRYRFVLDMSDLDGPA